MFRMKAVIQGLAQLEPGDVAVFPEGPGGAHQVVNRSAERRRVLVLSSKRPPAIVHYPDSAKVGSWSQAQGGQRLIREGPELDYWEGET